MHRETLELSLMHHLQMAHSPLQKVALQRLEEIAGNLAVLNGPKPGVARDDFIRGLVAESAHQCF